jgi:hypothetical protein
LSEREGEGGFTAEHAASAETKARTEKKQNEKKRSLASVVELGVSRRRLSCVLRG